MKYNLAIVLVSSTLLNGCLGGNSPVGTYYTPSPSSYSSSYTPSYTSNYTTPSYTPTHTSSFIQPLMILNESSVKRNAWAEYLPAVEATPITLLSVSKSPAPDVPVIVSQSNL